MGFLVFATVRSPSLDFFFFPSSFAVKEKSYLKVQKCTRPQGERERERVCVYMCVCVCVCVMVVFVNMVFKRQNKHFDEKLKLMRTSLSPFDFLPLAETYLSLTKNTAPLGAVQTQLLQLKGRKAKMKISLQLFLQHNNTHPSLRKTNKPTIPSRVFFSKNNPFLQRNLILETGSESPKLKPI